MKIGDKYLKLSDSKVYVLAGHQIYNDGVYMQTESKTYDTEFVGDWNREMKDDSGEKFICKGFAFGIWESTLLDTEFFEKII